MSKPIELSHPQTKHTLLRRIITDLHFWIPLAVLVGGFVLLDKLR